MTYTLLAWLTVTCTK